MAAAYPQRNYSIAAPDAWSERLEAQGFASPVWDSASGASLGNPQLIIDQAGELVGTQCRAIDAAHCRRIHQP